MSGLSTHVLDTARGRPAAGLAVVLERPDGAGGWRELARTLTGPDGRVPSLLPDGARLEPGDHRLTFELGPWYAAQGIAGFHPRATIDFTVRDPDQHHHVPLLVSPFGYTTYRGS